MILTEQGATSGNLNFTFKNKKSKQCNSTYTQNLHSYHLKKLQGIEKLISKTKNSWQRNFISHSVNKYQELKIIQALEQCQQNQVEYFSQLTLPFVKEDFYLRQAFNEELVNIKSGQVTKMRHLLDSYGMSNLILNIFKVLKDEPDKKEYKNKCQFFQKRDKVCCIHTLLYTYKKKYKQKNTLKSKDI